MRKLLPLAALVCALAACRSPTTPNDGGGLEPGGGLDGAGGGGGGIGGDGGGHPDGSIQPMSAHTRCGWIGGGDTVGESSFVAHAAQLNTVHPKWYNVNPDGVTVRKLGRADAPAVMQAARANHVRVMPLIDADDVARLRLFLADPKKRTQHVNALVAVVQAGGYAGLDIDYEHLWSPSDRAPFVAFMTELAKAFHARGWELSMAIPGLVADHGDSAYDYTALAAVVDTLHIMGYDFHYIGGDHVGPLAPRGWIDGALQHAVATGHVDHFVLGLANYALGSNWWTTTRDALSRCQGAPTTTTNHMASCPYGNYEAGRAVHCTTAQGEVWIEDLTTLEEKVTLARQYGARGITYWTIGDEINGFFDMLKRHYP